MSKPVINAALTFLVFNLIGYLFGSFVSADFNIAHWTDALRFFNTMGFLFLGFFMATIAGEMTDG